MILILFLIIMLQHITIYIVDIQKDEHLDDEETIDEDDVEEDTDEDSLENKKISELFRKFSK